MTTLSLFCFVILALTSTAYGDCKSKLAGFDKKVDKLLNDQIGVEFTGHYTYLYLAQIFDQHARYYPQVTKYMRKKSDEELSHAERFIQYQNQRGGTVTMESVERYKGSSCANVGDVEAAFKCAMELEGHVTSRLTQLHSDLLDVQEMSAADAIEDFDLRLTQPILVKCTTANDFVAKMRYWKDCDCTGSTVTFSEVQYVEIAEMIAHEFLGHQIEDTKEIASHYRTLKKMNDVARNGAGGNALHEYLFDKHLEL